MRHAPPKALLVAVGLALLGGCSAQTDLPAARAAVPAFHQMLNAGQSAAIYAASGPDMKKASSQADMVELFDAVHRKLGAFQSARETGWYENPLTAPGYVTLSYRSKYDNAPVGETFTWRVDRGHALLTSYFVNSRYLIVH